MKSDREHAGYECRELGPYMGRAIQDYGYRGSRSLLLGGPR